MQEKFPRVPCINCTGHTRTSYDGELLGAIAALSKGIPIQKEIDTASYDRETMKMALGMSCLAFGPNFLKSEAAAILRQFLFELDAEKRAAIRIPGYIP